MLIRAPQVRCGLSPSSSAPRLKISVQVFSAATGSTVTAHHCSRDGAGRRGAAAAGMAQGVGEPAHSARHGRRGRARFVEAHARASTRPSTPVLTIFVPYILPFPKARVLLICSLHGSWRRSPGGVFVVHTHKSTRQRCVNRSQHGDGPRPSLVCCFRACLKRRAPCSRCLAGI